MPDVLEPAQLELVDTALWYDERRDGYGDLFLREVADLFDLIDRLDQLDPPGTRRLTRALGSVNRFQDEQRRK